MTPAASVAQGGGARPLRVGAALAGIVLAAVLLFSLGVMTGARVALRAPEGTGMASAPPPAPAPAAPTVQPAAPGVPPGSLTFYDRLSGAAPPPPPVQADQPTERLAPGTAAVPGSPEASAPPTAAPAEASGAVNRESPPAVARPVAPARAAGGDAAARVKGLMGRGPYAVQVAAVSDRAAAGALAERLRRQGLAATTVSATSKGKTWYRLRVGSFPSRDAAVRAAGLLHAELGLDATPVRD